MDQMHIVLANDPRAYREVMAAALQALRPRHAVLCVEPDELDGEVARLDPELVLCSRLTPVVQRYALVWVMLYPDGDTRAVICVAGQHTTAGDLEFDRLLAIIDQAERLTMMSQPTAS